MTKQARITIRMNSAAFDEAPGEELRRILQEIIDFMEHDQEIAEHGGRKTLRDLNGNTCGTFIVDHV